MFDMIKKIWKTGIVTSRLPIGDAPEKYRGKLIIDEENCDGCNQCVDVCPTAAIELIDESNETLLKISYTKCIFCGICQDKCPTKAIRHSNEYRLGIKNKEDLMTRHPVKRNPVPIGSGEYRD